jgi:hypothetical protein
MKLPDKFRIFFDEHGKKKARVTMACDYSKRGIEYDVEEGMDYWIGSFVQFTRVKGNLKSN